MQKEILKTILPKHLLLQKFIKTYYVHICQDNDFRQKIIYYPNYNTTLNIYKNSFIASTEFLRTHVYSDTNKICSLLVGKFNRAREIKIYGPLNKLTVVFYPLGLNHFIDIPLSKLIEEHFSFFNYWGDSYDELILAVFSENNLEKKRLLLDDFFIQKYKPFKESRLINVISDIMESNGQIKVSDMADKIGISRKTLLRLFQKHLSYSVEEYLSVVRFRKALNYYQNQKTKPSLTKLAYESGYYDQPDFNRQFKFKTGMKPRQLFDQLQTVTKGLFWNLSE